MTRNFSFYLDLLRFLAALLVLASHWAYARFTDGNYIALRDYNLGSDAVVFFFVLSGLVIAYTTDVKDKTLGAFAFNRATRLYSVIIPALIIGIVFDRWGSNLAPQNYTGWFYHDASIWQQFLYGITLSNQWLYQQFRIGTNGPLWSLSYEAAYYILFGAALYFSGVKKYLLLLVAVLLFGIPVLLLLPAWLLGVWVYKEIKQGGCPDKLIRVLIIAPPLIYVMCLIMGISNILFAITYKLLGENFIVHVLGFSNEFIWNILIAVLVAFHLIGVASAYIKNKKEISVRIAKIIRWCAGASFTIYVVHYPALQFFDTVLPNDMMPLLRHVLLFGIVLGFCFAFAEVSERRLSWLRQKLVIKPS